MSTEHIMEILLAEKMFINCSTSLSGQHTVNQSFFYIYIYIYIYIPSLMCHATVLVNRTLSVTYRL